MIDKIIVVDIETTGPNYKEGDQIIQIGATVIENQQVTHQYTMFINPQQIIPSNIQHLTGIKQAQVQDAPTFEQVASLWHKRFENAVFVAHNVGFDLNYLKEFFQHNHIDFKPPMVIDTVVLAKILCPTAKGFNLTDLANQFSIRFDQAHDALSDALMTTHLLDRLSHLFEALEVEQQQVIRQLSQDLTDDEVYFFNNYQQFQINEDSSIGKAIERDTQDEIPSKDPLVHWVNDAWQNQSKLLLMNEQSIFDDQFIEQLVHDQSKKQIIITQRIDTIVDKLDRRVICLKYKEDFISQLSIEWLVEHFSELKINLTEKIQIIALYYWLQTTKDGLIEELHNDINAKIVIDKYVPNSHKKNKERFYRKYLRQLKKAEVILVSPYTLERLQRFIDKKQFNPEQYQLIIDGMADFYQGLTYLDQHEINLSSNFTSLQELFENLILHLNDHQQMTLQEQVLKLLRNLNQMIKYLDQQLKDHVQVFSSKQTNQHLSLTNKDKQQLIEPLEQVYKVASNIQFEAKNPHVTQLMNRLIQVVQPLIERDMVELDMQVKAIQLNYHYYQITLNYRLSQQKNALITSLERLTHVLVLDDGWYAKVPNVISFDYFNQFYKQRIPSLYSPIKTVEVPFSYLEESEEEAPIIQGQVTKFQKKKLDFMMQYLMDHSLDEKIIVITANRESTEYFFHRLTQSDLSGNYALEAVNVTGNSKRVARKLVEHEKAIIIFSRYDFQANYLNTLTTPATILIHTMPFDSPFNQQVQQVKLKNEWNDEQVFTDYLLPKMMWQLKKELLTIDQQLPLSNIKLFDERLFTKYYSNQVRESLKDVINFEISD